MQAIKQCNDSSISEYHLGSDIILIQTRAQSRTSLYLLVSSADRRDEVCDQDQFIISAVSRDTGHGLWLQWLGYSSEFLAGHQVLYRLYAANCRSCMYGSKYCLVKPRLNNLLSLYTNISDMLASIYRERCTELAWPVLEELKKVPRSKPWVSSSFPAFTWINFAQGRVAIVWTPNRSGCARKSLGNNLSQKCCAEMPLKLPIQHDWSGTTPIFKIFQVVPYSRFLSLVELKRWLADVHSFPHHSSFPVL